MSRAAAALVIDAKDPARVALLYEDVAELRLTERDEAFILLEGADIESVVPAIPAAIARTFEIAAPPERREVGGGLLDPAASEWSWRELRHCDGHDPEADTLQLRQPAVHADR